MADPIGRILSRARTLRILAGAALFERATKNPAELPEPSATSRLRIELSFLNRAPYDPAAEERARRAVEEIRAGYVRRLEGALRAAKEGSIDREEALDRIRTAIGDAFGVAFREGRASLGVLPGELIEDPETLRGAVEAEIEYATGFLDDVLGEPEKSVEDFAWRSRLYGETLGAIATIGQISGLPDDAVLTWRLSPNDSHCGDCLTLASAGDFGVPGNKIGLPDLPTIPGSGDTQCLCLADPTLRVLTRNGWREIEKIATGEEVWTHRKRWRRVVATHRRRLQPGEGVGFILGASGRWIAATVAHRFMDREGWKSLARVWESRCEVAVDGGSSAGWSLQVREAARATEEALSFLFGEGRGSYEVAGSELSLAAWRWGEIQKFAETADRRFEGERFPTDGVGSLEGNLLGSERQSVSSDLPLPVAMDQSTWADSGRNADSSSERTACRRRAVQLGVEGEGRAYATPHDSGSGRADLAEARSQAGSELEVRGVRLRFPEVREHCEAWRASALLLDDVPEHRDALADHGSTYLRDVRNYIPRSAGPREAAEILLAAMLRASATAELHGVEVRDVRSVLCGAISFRHTPTVLLEEVHPTDRDVYDLTVEEDHSFVVEGLVTHNSNCQCSLDVRSAQFGDIARPSKPGGVAYSFRDREVSATDAVDDEDLKAALAELDAIQARRVYWRQTQAASSDAEDRAEAAHEVALAQRELEARAKALRVDYSPNMRVQSYVETVRSYVDRGWTVESAGEGILPGDTVARIQGLEIKIGRVVRDEKSPSGLSLELPSGERVRMPKAGDESEGLGVFLRQGMMPAAETGLEPVPTPPGGGPEPELGTLVEIPEGPPVRVALEATADYVQALRNLEPDVVARTIGEPVEGLAWSPRPVRVEDVPGKSLLLDATEAKGPGLPSRSAAAEAGWRLAQELGSPVIPPTAAVESGRSLQAYSDRGLVAIAALPTERGATFSTLPIGAAALATEDLARTIALILAAGGATLPALIAQSIGGEIDTFHMLPGMDWFPNRTVPIDLGGLTNLPPLPDDLSGLFSRLSTTRLRALFGDLLSAAQLASLSERIANLSRFGLSAPSLALTSRT